MLKNNYLIIIFISFFFLIFSCKSDKNVENQKKSDSLTAREIGDFGFKIEQAIANNDTSKYYSLLHSDNLLKNAINQLKVNGDTLQFAKAIVINKLNQLKQLSVESLNSIVELAKIDTSSQSLTFSIFTGGRNLDFLELKLKNKNGIKIKDYTFYTQGASFFEQVLQTSAILHNKKIEQKGEFPFGYLQLQTNLFKLQDAIANQDNSSDSLSNIINKIPNNLLYLQEINNASMYIANMENNKRLTQELLEKKIEVSKSINIKTYLNYLKYSYNDQYSNGIDELKLLDSSFNDNVYLNYLIGTLYYELYDFNHAIEYYNASISKKPEIFDFHFAKIVAYIEMNEFDLAVESLLVMDDYFEMNEINWDKEFMAYPEFLMSDSYYKWTERITTPMNT